MSKKLVKLLEFFLFLWIKCPLKMMALKIYILVTPSKLSVYGIYDDA